MTHTDPEPEAEVTTESAPDYPRWSVSKKITLAELERRGRSSEKHGTITEWRSGPRRVAVCLQSHPDNPGDDPSTPEYWVNYSAPEEEGAGDEGFGGIHGSRAEAEATAQDVKDHLDQLATERALGPQ